MTPVLRAFALITLLVAMLVLLAKTGQEQVPVMLQWGSTQLSTTAPVVLTFVLLIVLVIFYTGRLIGWVVNIPAMLRAYWHGNRYLSTTESLTHGFTALLMADLKTATATAKALKPEASLQSLITLLKLHTNQLTAPEAETMLGHLILGPIVALHFARLNAARNNWAMVQHYTVAGLRNAANHPALLTLHFKALVNQGMPQATLFLPQLKPLVSRQTYQLLSTVVAAGITTPHAAALSHPWVKTFQKWLATDSETIPDAQNPR